MIYKRNIALIYRIAAMFITIFAVLRNVGILGQGFNPIVLNYYTLQSNIVIGLMFIYLSIKTLIDYKKNGKEGLSTYYPRIKGAFTLMIMVTFLIFWIMLAPQSFQMTEGDFGPNYLMSLDNNLVHTIVPLLALFDYLLFDQKGYFTKKDPFYWTIIPLLYFLFAVIRASFGGYLTETSKYPYFFIDFDLYGAWVLLYVFLIFWFFVGLGYLIVLIDRKIAKRQHQ